jgi:hypothetical protein
MLATLSYMIIFIGCFARYLTVKDEHVFAGKC